VALAQQAPLSEPALALPQHIAIIMDGNGRWARERGVSRVRGHSQGGEALRAILSCCESRPFIKYLTLYAFSIENWKRAPDEVDDLMNLLRHYVKREAAALHENNVRMRFIGELANLAPDIQRDLAGVEQLTKNNSGLLVTMAISYGARQEMLSATRAIAQKIAEGKLAPADITDATIQAHLHTSGIPDPDLLIRTGGEERLSNFLLWQSAYTELYFSETLWPDFTADHLDEAINAYSQRERRFGVRRES
jgi:undecaprenyl diphosphate synthase